MTGMHSPSSSPRQPRQTRWTLPRESYLIDADTLAAYEPLAKQFIGAGIWFFSLIGTVLSVDGWDGNRAAWNSMELAWSIAIAVSIQLVITAIQLITCKQWTNPLYLLSIAASSCFSFLGFREAIAVPLTIWVTGVPLDPFVIESATQVQQIIRAQPLYIFVATGIHGIVFATMVFADIVPERIFVRH